MTRLANVRLPSRAVVIAACLLLLCLTPVAAQDILWDAPNWNAFTSYNTWGIFFHPDSYAAGAYAYKISVLEGAALQDKNGGWHLIDKICAFYAVDTTGTMAFTAAPAPEGDGWALSENGWVWDTHPTTNVNNPELPASFDVAGWATEPSDTNPYVMAPATDTRLGQNTFLTFTYSVLSAPDDKIPAFGLHVKLFDSGVFLEGNTGYVLPVPSDKMPPTVPEWPAAILMVVYGPVLVVKAFRLKLKI